MIRSGRRKEASETNHNRKMASIRNENRQNNAMTYIDLDTHADTFCIGSDCRVLA
jgi:hypothetical protein